LIGGILAAATASSPVPTASSPAPCAPTAEAMAAAPLPSPAAPAAKGASSQPTRWTERPTQYASGDHLWFSWRASAVRWLGGQPVPTGKEVRAAAREGWWGETVNTPPSFTAFAVSER
jgi:hypothetical protein